MNFITSSRVVRVDHDGAVQAIEIGGLESESQTETQSYLRPLPGDSRGTRLAADTVLLAVDPATARDLIGEVSWPPMTPVLLSTLDVALSRLPQPKKTFAIGIDPRPRRPPGCGDSDPRPVSRGRLGGRRRPPLRRSAGLSSRLGQGDARGLTSVWR